jgi:chitin synthase
MLNITKQKYFCITGLLITNILLSSTFIIYSDKWYAYLFILSLGSIINSSSAILLLYKKLFNKTNNTFIYRTTPKNYTYVIPCYNESYDELNNSINSLVNQQTLENDNRSFIIICDGKVKGLNNNDSTDNILKQILNIDNTKLPKIVSYKTASPVYNINYLELYKGKYKNIPYLLMIKQNNYGKRDSIVIARRLCYLFNSQSQFQSQFQSKFLSNKLIKYCFKFFKKNLNNSFKIDYIIGIDADTLFEYRCTYELIKKLELENKNLNGDRTGEGTENQEGTRTVPVPVMSPVLGCVGFVDINLGNGTNKVNLNKWSLFILYQYAEYIYSQCLRRQAQSNITHKVNCLSGCNQILVICEETCGDKILNKFNYLPKEDENIFNHIRSYASEDRNHVCLMLSMYPYVKTVQTLDAIAYTNVPNNIKIFASQRRRWSLGAISNDMLLVYLSGINIFERIASLINIITYICTPFISIASALFIKTILTSKNYLLLYLSIIIMIPLTYGISIPMFIKPMIFKDALYYYISYIIYIILSIPVSFCIYIYSIINMDIIKWGKTRQIEKLVLRDNNLNEESIIDIIENDIIENDIINENQDANENANINLSIPDLNINEYLTDYSYLYLINSSSHNPITDTADLA